MSQDTSERQLEGHQQLRQTDASLSEEHDNTESTENISIIEVCPLHELHIILCIYLAKMEYKNVKILKSIQQIYIFTLTSLYFLHSQQQQVDTRQPLVVDDNTQTDEQILQTDEVETIKEIIPDKKKSLKEKLKEKTTKLKKFIETKSTGNKKQKDVRMNNLRTINRHANKKL